MPSTTFNYTGAAQTWTVPAGVTSITVDMAGAAGQVGGGGIAGRGGRLQVTLTSNPGDTWNIYVGGAAGFNGGGTGGSASTTGKGALEPAGGNGGGATDIRVSGTALGNRTAVAGGGGGSGSVGTAGAGGGTTGGSGYTGTNGGGGGSQSAGGTGGLGSIGGSGGNGALGTGGVGQSQAGSPGAGAGGGGYYGGGGGGGGGYDGGGGSSYSGSGTSVAHTQGYQAGNGYVTLTWIGGVAPPSSTLLTLGVG